MIKNYIKVAVRNLLKRKGFSLINIFGLAIGMAVCLLIVLYVQSELSYDELHKKAENIYRAALHRNYPGRTTSYPIIPQSFAGALATEFPEVAESVRIFNFGGDGNNLFTNISRFPGVANYTALRIKASEFDKAVTAMFSKDFLKQVLIGSLIAFPLAWWGMHKWLDEFAYRVDIGWWVFAVAAGLAAAVALFTISFQAIRAALGNPVKSLRTE